MSWKTKIEYDDVEPHHHLLPSWEIYDERTKFAPGSIYECSCGTKFKVVNKRPRNIENPKKWKWVYADTGKFFARVHVFDKYDW